MYGEAGFVQFHGIVILKADAGGFHLIHYGVFKYVVYVDFHALVQHIEIICLQYSPRTGNRVVHENFEGALFFV